MSHVPYETALFTVHHFQIAYILWVPFQTSFCSASSIMGGSAEREHQKAWATHLWTPSILKKPGWLLAIYPILLPTLPNLTYNNLVLHPLLLPGGTLPVHRAVLHPYWLEVTEMHQLWHLLLLRLATQSLLQQVQLEMDYNSREDSDSIADIEVDEHIDNSFSDDLLAGSDVEICDITPKPAVPVATSNKRSIAPTSLLCISEGLTGAIWPSFKQFSWWRWQWWW